MTVRVSSPGELVSMIPSLLGFSPEDSLVVLFLTCDGSLVCTMRVDVSASAVEVSRRIVDLAARENVTGIVSAVYAESVEWRESAGPLWVDEIFADVLVAGVRVLDSLLVVGDRWWSLFCEQPSCCPTEGHQVVSETRSTREDIENSYTLREPLEESLVIPPRLPLAEQCDLALELLRDSQSDPSAAGQLLAMVQHVHVRDWVLAHIIDDVDLIDAVVDLVLRAPDAYRSRIAGLAAAALATRGDNPVGVHAMVSHAGTDSLAAMVAMSVDLAFSPAVFRELITASRERILTVIRDQDRASA